MKSSSVCSLTIVVVLLLATIVPETTARPYKNKRQKRVSDQRLAEIETLNALNKMRGKLVTVPIGFGIIDPKLIGRRRRRAPAVLRSNSLEELEHSITSLQEQVEGSETGVAASSSLSSEEERPEGSAQYEDLLRQYLLAWARQDADD